MKKLEEIDYEDNFSAIKYYLIESQTDFLEDYKIDDFIKLQSFINARINRIKIDPKTACIF